MSIADTAERIDECESSLTLAAKHHPSGVQVESALRSPIFGNAILLAGLLLFGAESARAGSETPPHGPPWVRDFAVAQRDALTRGVPIFVYLTKTY